MPTDTPMRIVPVEATEEMIEAGCDKAWIGSHTMKIAYAAMIAAAPPVGDEVVERWARTMAMWHGQKITHVIDGQNQTVANRRGFDHFGWSIDKYVEAHWHEYVEAARAILATLQGSGT